MKELSIEQKAKRYDEALKVAKDIRSGKAAYIPNGTTVIEAIFPELEEGRDERIRKSIIGFLITISSLKDGKTVSNEDFDSKTILEWVAWLEKQDKSAEINPDEIIEECHQDNADHIIDIVTEQRKPFEWSEEDENKYSATEAIKEEKVDKVEPKFKAGDWLQYRNAKPFYVEGITSQGYVNGISCLPFSWEDEIHLWSIADAQAGDVLVASDGSIFLFAGVVDCACKYYVSLTAGNYVKINKNKEVKGGYWETSRAVHPATKEQCALLFQKMREEGYEWDSEKKKLKKIMESNETN